jgi:hypothetical protein
MENIPLRHHHGEGCGVEIHVGRLLLFGWCATGLIWSISSDHGITGNALSFYFCRIVRC